MNADVLVTFKAKRQVDDDGRAYVKLVEPKSQHLTMDNMMTAKAVLNAWQALFGQSGRVPEDHPMVTEFGDGFMPTVRVVIPDAREVAKYYREQFWPRVDAHRSAGLGLIEAENAAHADMLEHLTGRKYHV